jgi:glycosyltransferase involved in cell wall biosynthesis
MVNSFLPLVTIGIPTYDRAGSYLPETLTSALNQIYEDLEIIVADNCSTDNTERYVNNISDPRIRYFRHAKNIRANDNFNFCLQQAKGDYFLLLHDDDLIDQDFVSICMETANYRKDIGIIRTGMRRIDTNGNIIRERTNLVEGLSTDDFFLAWFSGRTPMHLCCTLFHTKRLREIGGFRSKHELFQDVIAEVQLAASYGRVDVEDVKASFRNHPLQNTVSAKVTAWCEDSLELLDVMCELTTEKRSLVRNEGMRFFAKHNYNIARKIKSPLDRLRASWTIYKKFDYEYSPLRFFISRNIVNPMSRMARKMKKWFV